MVEFFRDWCTEDEIKARAFKHIENLKQGTLNDSHAYHITETLAQLLLPGKDQDQLISNTQDFLVKKNSEWANSLTLSDFQLMKKGGIQLGKTNDRQIALSQIKKIRNKVLRESLISLLTDDRFFEISLDLLEIFLVEDNPIIIDFFVLSSEETNSFDKLIALMSSTDFGAARLALVGIALIQVNYCEKAEKVFLSIAEKKHNENLTLSGLSKKFLAILNHYHFGRYQEAERLYLEAINEGQTKIDIQIANLYRHHLKNFDEAVKFYKNAVEEKNVTAMFNLAELQEFELGHAEEAQVYYQMAAEHKHPQAIVGKALLEFNLKTKSVKSLEQIHELWESDKSIAVASAMAICNIWHNEFQKAFEVTPYLISNHALVKESIGERTKVFLMLLLAKKQYHFTHRLFEESTIDLKDRYKPIYYALMHFMRDKYPDEILKMGPELKETVDEVIARVEQMAIDYA